jgi:hypothetical protein
MLLVVGDVPINSEAPMVNSHLKICRLNPSEMLIRVECACIHMDKCICVFVSACVVMCSKKSASKNLSE